MNKTTIPIFRIKNVQDSQCDSRHQPKEFVMNFDFFTRPHSQDNNRDRFPALGLGFLEFTLDAIERHTSNGEARGVQLHMIGEDYQNQFDLTNPLCWQPISFEDDTDIADFFDEYMSPLPDKHQKLAYSPLSQKDSLYPQTDGERLVSILKKDLTKEEEEKGTGKGGPMRRQTSISLTRSQASIVLSDRKNNNEKKRVFWVNPNTVWNAQDEDKWEKMMDKKDASEEGNGTWSDGEEQELKHLDYWRSQTDVRLSALFFRQALLLGAVKVELDEGRKQQGYRSPYNIEIDWKLFVKNVEERVPEDVEGVEMKKCLRAFWLENRKRLTRHLTRDVKIPLYSISTKMEGESPFDPSPGFLSIRFEFGSKKN